MDRRSTEELILMAGRSMSRRPAPRQDEGSPLLTGIDHLIEQIDGEIAGATGVAVRELKRARRDLIKAKGRVTSAGRA